MKTIINKMNKENRANRGGGIYVEDANTLKVEGAEFEGCEADIVAKKVGNVKISDTTHKGNQSTEPTTTTAKESKLQRIGTVFTIIGVVFSVIGVVWNVLKG